MICGDLTREQCDGYNVYRGRVRLSRIQGDIEIRPKSALLRSDSETAFNLEVIKRHLKTGEEIHIGDAREQQQKSGTRAGKPLLKIKFDFDMLDRPIWVHAKVLDPKSKSDDPDLTFVLEWTRDERGQGEDVA